jgi:hypothetical protein
MARLAASADATVVVIEHLGTRSALALAAGLPSSHAEVILLRVVGGWTPTQSPGWWGAALRGQGGCPPGAAAAGAGAGRDGCNAVTGRSVPEGDMPNFRG